MTNDFIISPKHGAPRIAAASERGADFAASDDWFQGGRATLEPDKALRIAEKHEGRTLENFLVLSLAVLIAIALRIAG